MTPDAPVAQKRIQLPAALLTRTFSGCEQSVRLRGRCLTLAFDADVHDAATVQAMSPPVSHNVS